MLLFLSSRRSTIPTLLPKMVTDNAKNTAHGRGHIIGHVKDIGHDIDQPITRVYATPLAQPWHNDSVSMKKFQLLFVLDFVLDMERSR